MKKRGDESRVDGEVLAESVETVVEENNHYFPPQSVRRRFSEIAKRTQHARGKVKPPITPWK